MGNSPRRLRNTPDAHDPLARFAQRKMRQPLKQDLFAGNALEVPAANIEATIVYRTE